MFLCDFVLFCANKSILSTPEGHGIQEVSGSIPLGVTKQVWCYFRSFCNEIITLIYFSWYNDNTYI